MCPSPQGPGRIQICWRFRKRFCTSDLWTQPRARSFAFHCGQWSGLSPGVSRASAPGLFASRQSTSFSLPQSGFSHERLYLALLDFCRGSCAVSVRGVEEGSSVAVSSFYALAREDSLFLLPRLKSTILRFRSAQPAVLVELCMAQFSSSTKIRSAARERIEVAN